MAGFDSPLETWNARFAREDFLFGEEPNAFLRTQAHWLRPGGSVLCVADGEGRNSVWLAEQGFRVTAFDFAPNAVAKATRLRSAERKRQPRSRRRIHLALDHQRYDGLVACHPVRPRTCATGFCRDKSRWRLAAIPARRLSAGAGGLSHRRPAAP